MEDKFDKILSNKIRELSNNNEIPYNPEHWNMLLSKKNKKKKRIFLYWKYAAVILMALFAGGLGNYFYKSSISNENMKPKIIFDKTNDSLRLDTLKKNPNVIISSINVDSLININSKIVVKDSTNKIIPHISKKRGFKAINTKVAKNNTKLKNASNNKVEIDSIILKKSDLINKIENDFIVQSVSDTLKDVALIKEEIVLKEKEVTKDSLIEKENLIALVEEEKTKLENSKRAVKVGLSLSPILDSYQENENSNIGFSGGVMIEIPLFKNFHINSGVYYADQKLDLNKPSNYLVDGVSAKESKQIVNKEAVIKGIEIPLNIKYNFNVNKKNVFVSAGFSSTSYITENIESEYLVNNRTELSTQDSFGNNIVQYNLVQLSEKVITENKSNAFNLANALNFSLGIELPVNKQHQSIIIEPYFKYSLQSVTQQKIDFNSAGVHLRYNFSFQKK